MSIRIAPVALLLALPLASCVVVLGPDGDGGWTGRHGSTVRGSGVRAEVDREVGEFRSVRLEVCANVLVRVGEEPSIHLAGDDNLLGHVETRVEKGRLSIDLDGSASFRCGLEIVIGTPTLEGFTIEGSGDVRIQDLAAERVRLAIEGSGTLRAEGTARSVEGSIEGSGDMDLAALETESAELSIEGSGSMDVLVARELRYEIEGSGHIRYAGGADVDGRIEGSGRIERGR